MTHLAGLISSGFGCGYGELGQVLAAGEGRAPLVVVLAASGGHVAIGLARGIPG